MEPLLLLWLAWMAAAFWLGRWPRKHAGTVWFAVGTGIGVVGVPLIFWQLFTYFFDPSPLLPSALLLATFAMAFAALGGIWRGPRPIPLTSCVAAFPLAVPLIWLGAQWGRSLPIQLRQVAEEQARQQAWTQAEQGRDTRADWVRAVGAPPAPAPAKGIPQRAAEPEFPRLMPFSTSKGSYTLEPRLTHLTVTLCTEIPAVAAPYQSAGWITADIRPSYALNTASYSVRAPLRWNEMWTKPPGQLPPVACADLEVPRGELEKWPTAPTQEVIMDTRADNVQLNIGGKVWRFQQSVQE